MTVKDLIDELDKFPKDLAVFQNIGDGLYSVNEVKIIRSTRSLKPLVGNKFILIG